MSHYEVPQQIIQLLEPQFTMDMDGDTVVLSKRFGTTTLSVRGCQPGRSCISVVAQGGSKIPLMETYRFPSNDISGICACLRELIKRYNKKEEH